MSQPDEAPLPPIGTATPVTASASPSRGAPSLTGPLIMAVVVPLVGVILGCVALAREQVGRGLLLLLVSVAAFILWAVVFGAVLS